MSIVAALDKVLFFNASSKYSVLRMKTEDSSVPTEARSPYRYHDHLIRFTAVGIELPQTDTVKIEMDGEWKDGKYGLQLQVDHWQEIVPPTLEGVRNYLASGLLKGIGEKTADAIIEKFGVNALEILEHQPDRLLEIRGITKERLAEIKDAYAETSRMRVLMTLLAPFKVTPTTAQKTYQQTAIREEGRVDVGEAGTQTFLFDEAVAADLMYVLEHVDCRACSNQEILTIILDEADAFFQGRKTAQEAARIMDSRAALFIAENS